MNRIVSNFLVASFFLGGERVDLKSSAGRGVGPLPVLFTGESIFFSAVNSCANPKPYVTDIKRVKVGHILYILGERAVFHGLISRVWNELEEPAGVDAFALYAGR